MGIFIVLIIHVCTMIVAFLDIFIILLSVACTMFVALLGVIIILFLFQQYVLWLCFPKQISSLDLCRLAEMTKYLSFIEIRNKNLLLLIVFLVSIFISKLDALRQFFLFFFFCIFLAHLSRRLTRWAYSIPMVRRPSVVRHPHFQTWISLKPVGQSWLHFMCSITGVGERLHKVLGQIGSKLCFPWQQKGPIDL